MAKSQKRKKSHGGNASPKKRRLTNFERYLEMENAQARVTATDDVELEKRLAKRLNLKNGRIKNIGDNLADLLGEEDDAIEHESGGSEGDETEDEDVSEDEAASDAEDEVASDAEDEDEDAAGVAEDADSEDEGVDEEASSEDEGVVQGEEADESDECESEGSESDDEQGDELEDSNSEEETTPGTKAAATKEQKYVPPHLKATGGQNEDEIRLKRRLKGLLNRISEDSIESITSEISDLFLVHPRHTITELITSHVVESCLNGPRGNEQYASVFAAFAAGLACLVGIDFGAFFAATVATSYEEACKKKDGLASRNLALLISALYNFNAFSSDLIYGFLQHLCHRFSEIDVSTILHMMQSSGLALRNSDPSSMKEFILSVQKRSSELKQSYEGNESEAMSKRVEYMLEAICEVKNNKRRAKDEPAKHTRLKKWLHKLRVEDIRLTSVTWTKLLDPQKKGQWWQQVASDNAGELPNLLNTMDTGVAEAEKMLKLAASQRMNTDARRAVFSIVMSSEDYVDAFEKLLSLNLNGTQDREIVRVVVECCLQEKVFNKYYALLTSKLCHHDKKHKFTLQYCVWDHFKELAKMELRRSVNLAKLLAFLVGSSALSLTVLRTIQFGDSRFMTAKLVVHFRALFEALFQDCSDEFIVTTFSRIASMPQSSELCDGLGLFLRQLLQHSSSSSSDLFVKRCHLARKALRITRV